MITSMTSANNKSYQNFFKNVSMLLRTHAKNGEPCGFGAANAALESKFEPADISSETFEPNVYYIDDAKSGGKKLATSYEADVIYYNAPKNDITSLEEYFANIELIAKIKPIYTRLPLDEPLFEIDLNSRVVKIPQEFQKNGVGIQGDHIAESIYFACPRFFDTTDLGNEKYNIFIQWENAEGVQRVSVPTIRDIESKPGYVIFDLPICDKITQKAGNVKVAIRFYRIDGDEIFFSLSTQPFSVSIKAGLNFENFEQLIQDDELDDHKDLIRARFIDSSLTGVEVEVDPPVFSSTLPNYHIVKEGENEKTIAADGDGIVSYSWRRKYLAPRGYDEDHPHGYTMDQIRDLYPLGDDPVINDHGRDDEKVGMRDLSFKGKTELVKIENSEVYNAKKDYYVKSENGYNIYVEDKTQFDDYKAQNIDIFEQKSFAIIDKVGKYYVVATNRKGSTEKTAESNVMTVEYPAKPIFMGSTNFSWNSRENYPDSHYCIIGDTANGHQKIHSVTAVAPEQTDDKGAKTHGELSFQWYYAPLTTMNFSRTAENPNTVFTPIEDGFSQSLSIEEEGYYRVLVTNTLNGETDSVTSGIIRATNKASKPVVLKTSDSDNRIDINSTITVFIDEESLEPAENRISSDCEAKNIFGEDTITYKWYKYTGTADDLEKGDEKAAKDGEFLSAGSKGEELPNEVSASFKPQERGTYFCIITNSYNGNKNSASSPMIYVF